MRQSIVKLAVEWPEFAVLKIVESSWIRPFRILGVKGNRDNHPTFGGICEVSDGDT